MAIKNYFFIMLFAMLLFVVPGISHGATFFDNRSDFSSTSSPSYVTQNGTNSMIPLGQLSGSMSGGTLYVEWQDADTGQPNTQCSTDRIYIGTALDRHNDGLGDVGTWYPPASYTTTAWGTCYTSYTGVSFSNGNYISLVNDIYPHGYLSTNVGYTPGSGSGGSDWYYGKPTTVNETYAYVGDTAPSEPCLGCSAPASTSISFILPNASGTSPDFNNWLLMPTFSTSTAFGRIKVFYGQSSSTYDYVDQMDYAAYLNTVPVVLPKHVQFYFQAPNNIPQTYYAMAEYVGDGFDVTSTQIHFNIDPTATYPVNSSTLLTVYHPLLPYTNPSSTASSALPYADCGITAIGGCLTNAGTYLADLFFRPSDASIYSMNANFDHIKGSFPFSAFFNVIDTAKANATTTSGNYDLYLTIPATGNKIPILTSTTLEMAIGSSSKAMVFTTEKNIIWLGTGVAMLSLLLL